MTITAAASEVSYNADSVTVSFSVPFPFDTSADLKVFSTDSNSAVTPISTGFTVSGGDGSTGAVLFSVAPVTGLKITIIDDPAQTQPTEYVSLDAFPAESHERALDRVTRLCKRLHQQWLRTLRFPDGDTVTDGSVAPIATRKGKYLFFNAVTGAVEYAVNLVTTTLTQSLIGGLLNPQTAAELAAGVTPVNYSYATSPGHNVLRYSGVVADGVTDCTTPLLTAMNAMGAGSPSTSVLFVIPKGVLYDTKTLLATLAVNVLILDNSGINDYISAGSTAKRVGITSSDTSVNDSAWYIASGHHPGITLNNFGTAGTSSATNRVASIDWTAGQFRNGGLANRGTRFAAHNTWSKDGNVWSWQLISDAPWLAITAEYELWSAGMAVVSGVTYCVNAANIYVSAVTGSASATPPTHTSGTANGWTWVDSVGRNVMRVDQNGRTLFGSGAYTYQWNYYGTPQDADGGQVAVNWQAAGVSQKVIQRWTPTTAGGGASSVPFIEVQDGVGIRIFNSAKTQELMRYTESAGTQIPAAQFSIAVSAAAPDPGNNGTIATANIGTARVQPSGNQTGWILQAGTSAGQLCFVENNSAFTGTFAVAATSNVADGATSAIPALAGRLFQWSVPASRWFRAA